MRAIVKCLFVLGVVMVASSVVWAGGLVQWNGQELDPALVSSDEAPSMEFASGTDLDALPPADPDWGTSSWITMSIGPGDFVRRWDCSSNYEPDLTNFEGISPKSGQSGACIGAPVHLPAGARLQYVRLVYYDSHPSSNPSMGLYRFNGYGPSNTSITSLSPSAWSSGNRSVDFGPLNYTIDNDGGYLGQPYHILAILHRSTGTPTQVEKVFNVLFWYTLQVSPAPASATFNDVSTGYWAFRYIEALAASGITAGCGGGAFCPEQSVTRAEMAVFLAKALGLHYPY